ncbi:MAG: membrane protein insertase YidC [Ignavibacteriales bacterium]|nr:membrane protein insertase YidC [Ignavibacteriales bacterium]
MDKQTTLAFILIGAILVVWLYFNTPTPTPPQTKNPKDSLTVQNDSQNVDGKTKTLLSQSESNILDSSKSKNSLGNFFSASNQQEKIITVETDLSIIEFSSKGGNIKKLFLKKYNNWNSGGNDADENFYKKGVQLINYLVGNAFDVSFVTVDGKAINTTELDFSSSQTPNHISISGKDSATVSFLFTVADDKYLKKDFVIYADKYNLTANVNLVGLNDVISNRTFDIVWNGGLRFVEENAVDEANYSNASVYYGDEQVIIDASDLGEKASEDFNGKVEWIAVRNKYFASIIVPINSSEVDGAYIEGSRKSFSENGVKEFYNTRLSIPFAESQNVTNSFLLYIGPVDYDNLKAYNKNLEKLVDFGSFFGLKFIVRPIAEYVLLPLFKFLHDFIPNYGFVIIVFSLIIKLVLYPLTKTSMKSMKKMQLLQPKIAELKEKFKDDPQKVNKETMKLYSTYGVNPAGGCLPILLQMPIFVAMWGLFQTAIELRHQPFALWINDLSKPDMIYDLGFKIPLFGVQYISGLALLMGITTFFQQKMSVKDPSQKALVYVMPIMLTFLFMSFPSGLNLYYFMFNVFSIAQQYYINQKHDGTELVPVKNPQKKKGFMEKLMEAAEKNASSKGGKKK